MKGRAISYSLDELAFIYLRREMPRAEMHAAFVDWFWREDVSLVHLNSLCKRRGWMTGRTGGFEKGQEPHNKGRPHPVAAMHPNCRKNQFRPGRLPHNTKHAGHERVSKEGYVEISVEDPNPHTGFGRRYVAKHRWLWEQVNGPLPRGYALKCLDGNRANTDPTNWDAIPRAMLPRLNGGRHKKRLAYDEAPAELKPTIMAVAKLDHSARSRRREAGTNPATDAGEQA